MSVKTGRTLAEYVKQRDDAGLPVGALLRRASRSKRGARPLTLGGGTREQRVVDIGQYPLTDIGLLMLRRDLALAQAEQEFARRRARRVARQAPR